MNKVAMFVFNGDSMCFIHVLLNALDMKKRGYEVKIVVEGAATRLLPELAKKENPLCGLWEKARGEGLVEGACLACSKKSGTLEAAKEQGAETAGGHDRAPRHGGVSRRRLRDYNLLSSRSENR